MVVESFLGPSITAAGLIGGEDLLKLPADPRPLLISDQMLNADGLFLDCLTPQQLQRQLDRRVCIITATGRGLIDFLERELHR